MNEPPRIPRPRPQPSPLLGRLLAAGLLLALAPAAHAQSATPCSEPGKNMQCTEFGTIAMDAQRDIRGDAIDVTVAFTLNTSYAEQGSRWLLVSVRNLDAGGPAPVTVDLVRFAGVEGEIFTTRVEQPSPGQVDLWVGALDMPVGTPVKLDLRVGATERGAFRLEALVMAFDRGYEPMRDAAGNDASLFSSTLLGVNEESEAGSHGSILRGNKVPGPGVVPALGALAAVALLLRRRAA